MYKYEERIVKFNGIALSNSGFKDLKFETSRYSDSLNTIRGFGAQMNESNLSVVDTISIDFILKTDELNNLAIIYNMFKAIGVLPIENYYLTEKISDTLSGGNSTKAEYKHLLCFLERLQITSLEKTSNGYDVNMILTLYQNSFVGNQFETFQQSFSEWNQKTKFIDICSNKITKYVSDLSIPSKSDLTINVYNIEKLNAHYKSKIIDSEKINKLLDGDTEIEAAIEEGQRIDYVRKKLPKEEMYIPTSIKINNENIIQVELITTNMISNFPMKGKPIGYKSFLGLGKSTFGIKLLFDESENYKVQELKNISDKNIINHKLIANHPLVQLFDFYSSDITNITFNNVESASGIVVTILFNVSGFRYDENEELTNSSDIILKEKVSNYYIDESIGGLYLENLSNYLYRNRFNKSVDINNLTGLMETPLETKTKNVNNDVSGQKNTGYDTQSYYFIDLLSSYSSQLTSFGYHTSNDLKVKYYPNFTKEDKYNSIGNKTIQVIGRVTSEKHIHKDIFYISDSADDPLNLYRDFKLTHSFYNFLDSISIYSFFSTDEYKNTIYEKIYKTTNSSFSEYLLEQIINPLGVELFNEIQNPEMISFGLYSKIYEEFYYRLFDICLNVTSVSQIIEKLKKEHNLCNYKMIDFNTIHNYIYELSNLFINSFLSTLKDNEFIERIIIESQKLTVTDNKDEIERQVSISKDSCVTIINSLLSEISYQFNNNKKEIIDKIYNIFLTKLNYFLFFKLYDSENSYNYELSKLSCNDQVKILLLSSTFFAPLFLYNKHRTDHFGKAITIGMQNIGIKIAEFNRNLTGFTGENKIIDDNPLLYMFNQFNKKEERFLKPDNIYQLFTTLFGEKVYPSYYMSVLTNESIVGKNNNYFNYDENINKDFLYFYGKKLSRYDIYSKIESIIKTKETEEAKEIIVDFLSKAKKDFLSGEKYSDAVPKELLLLNKPGNAVQDYGFNSLNKIIRYHLSDIPSYYKSLFLEKNINIGQSSVTKINDTMKSRIIGSNDMFKNLHELSNTITDSSYHMIPDYVISIVKKVEYSEHSGEINNFISKEYELFANNINSISVSKDPSTKIKTATIEIVNVKKHIFSVGEDGSFNIKEISNGIVDVIRIEPGDEIRIKIGDINSNNIFNGVITDIKIGNNTMSITCSAFGAAIYGYNIPNLYVANDWSLLKKVGKALASISIRLLDRGIIKTENISYLYEICKDMTNILNPNKHLFNIFPKKYNDIGGFLNDKDRETGFFVIASLALRGLPRRILDKIDGKLSNITSHKLLNSKIVIKDLDKALGSAEASDEMTNSTLFGGTFKNLNNIDHDYETYGMNEMGKEFEIDSSGDIIVNKPSEEFIQDYVSGTMIPSTGGTNDAVLQPDVDPIIKLEDGENMFTTWPCLKIKRISALFGEKRTSRDHKGIDIANHGATDTIVAAGDGIIERINNDPRRSGGKYVVIKHEIISKENKTTKILYTWYMHLERITITSKGPISAGTPIGVMGWTGLSRKENTHLHFEIRDPNNKRVNPLAKGVFPKFNLIFKNNLDGKPGQYVEEVRKGEK